MGAQRGGTSGTKEELSSEDARALGDACVEAIEYLGVCGEGWRQGAGRSLQEAAIEGLRLASSLLATSPDPADLPRLVRWLEVVERFDEQAPSNEDLLGESLAPVLSVARELGDDVQAAVESGHAVLRLSLAYALEPKGPAAIGMLRVLAGDSDSSVRARARGHLAGVEEVPWWQGKFSRDPLAMLAPREQKAAAPALAALSKALDDDTHDDHDRTYWARVRAALDALPDPVALDFLSRRLGNGVRHDPGAMTMLRALLRRPGADELVWKLGPSLIRKSTLTLGLHRVAGRTARLEEGNPEHRAAQCIALARRLFAHSARARGERGALYRIGGVLVPIIEHQWPLEADPTPLVDVLLASADSEGEATGRGPLDHDHTMLEAFLAQEVPVRSYPRALVERFIDAHARGYPGPWGELVRIGHAVVGGMPVEHRRLLAERLLSERLDDEGSSAWALGVLSGDGYDEALDGPRARLARAWCSVLALRKAVLGASPVDSRVLPFVREELLLGGALSCDEASRVARAVRSLFDGDVPLDAYDSAWKLDPARAPAFWTEEDHRREDWRAERRAALGPWLASGGRVGPLGDDEFAKLRAAREREPNRGAPETTDEGEPLELAVPFREYIETCPARASAWTAEERAVADAWLALHERKDVFRRFARHALIEVLAAADRPEDLRWFESYFCRGVPGGDEESLRAYERFCARTGVAHDERLYDRAHRARLRAAAGDALSSSDDGDGDDF